MTTYQIVGIFAALVGVVVVIFRPIWGIGIVVFLTPLKSYEVGQGLFSAGRIAGIVVVVAALISFSVRRGKVLHGIGLEKPLIVIVLGMSLSFFRTSNLTVVALSIVSLTSLYFLALIVANLTTELKNLKFLVAAVIYSSVFPVYIAISEYQTSQRPSGTFSTATGLGEFLFPVVLFGIPFLVSRTFGIVNRVLMSAVVAGALFALILSGSRAPIFGTGLGILVIMLSGRLRLRSRPIIGVALLILLSLAVVRAANPATKRRLYSPASSMMGSGRVTDRSLEAREAEFSVASELVLGTYFMGTGIGNYRDVVIKLRSRTGIYAVPGAPHNIFLYFFGMVGLVGALGFVWFLVLIGGGARWAFRVGKTSPQGVIGDASIGTAAAFAGYAVYMIFHSGFFSNTFWLFVGVLAAMLQVISQRPELIESRREGAMEA